LVVVVVSVGPNSIPSDAAGSRDVVFGAMDVADFDFRMLDNTDQFSGPWVGPGSRRSVRGAPWSGDAQPQWVALDRRGSVRSSAGRWSMCGRA
jgi:hypothetical protein